MPATGKVVLDTSVVVAALRRVPGVAEQLQQPEELLVPLTVLGELEYGAERASHPSRQREAMRIFRRRAKGSNFALCTRANAQRSKRHTTRQQAVTPSAVLLQ